MRHFTRILALFFSLILVVSTPVEQALAASKKETKAATEEQAAEKDTKSSKKKAQSPYQPAPKQIIISFVGDCTLGNTPEMQSKSNSFQSVIAKQGMNYPFVNVAEIFRNDDLTVANLEGVFCNTEKGKVKKKSDYNFRAPTDMAAILPLSSIEAVNIANNHSLDYGAAGEASTIAALEAQGTNWFGINEAANGTYIFEKDGVKIGFMGIHYTYWANPRKEESAKRLKTLSDLKAAGCNLIIASIHAGVEYSPTHDGWQEKMANWAIKNGADIVIGHHPHCVQGIRVENGRTTLWSLGNFVFGGNPDLRTKKDKNHSLNIESFIAQFAFSFDENNVYLGHQFNIIPCYFSGSKEYNNYQPILVTGSKAQRVLDAIQLDTASFQLKPYVKGVGAVQDFIPAPQK